MWRSKKVWGIIAAIILVVAGGWYFWTTKQDAEKVNYTTGKVEKGTISIVVDATGTINPVTYVDVSTNVSGQLKEVLVKENQVVKQGDTIALIDDRSLKAHADKAYATLVNAQADFQRYETLYKQGAVAAQAYDNALLTLQQAQATYDDAASSLSDTTITAPMDGTVIGEPLKAGQTVSQGLSSQMIIATIADLSDLEIYLTIDETDIGNIAEGQKVTFTVDAFSGETFNGVVDSISKGKKGEMGTTSSTVVYYTVKVKIPSNESGKLLPSMTARASIHGKEAKDTLLVPLTAIRSDRSGDFVYMINNGKAEKKYIKLGITGETAIQVLEGLKEGDEIVVSGDVGNTSTSSTAVRGPI